MSENNVSDSPGKLVILGHTGFVGGRLYKYFSNKGIFSSVVGISSRNIDLEAPGNFLELSKKLDAETTVIMCSGIKSNFGNNVENYISNVRMVENVVKAIQLSPVKRFVFLSSIAVYGVYCDNGSISEDSKLVPDTYYGLSKQVSENLLKLAFKDEDSTKLVLLRIPTIYGPNEKIRVETPSGFMVTYMLNEQVTLYGDGSEKREFLFIDDLENMLYGLCFNNHFGPLNPSNGHGESYIDALNVVSDILKSDIKINFTERTMSKIDKVYDGALYQSIFPDFRFTSLKDGLKIVYALQRNDRSP